MLCYEEDFMYNLVEWSHLRAVRWQIFFEVEGMWFRSVGGLFSMSLRRV